MSLLHLQSSLEMAYRRTLSEDQVARMEAKWRKKPDSIPACVKANMSLYIEVKKALGWKIGVVPQ